MKNSYSGIGEYGYLVHLLSCAIHGATPKELPEGLSFVKVYQYAMDHDVANLAFYSLERLKVKPNAELYKKWEHRRDLALVRDILQDCARKEILAEFESRGILYKELQGTVLKKLYPRTEYRTMSDLDFVVEKSRLQECGEILSGLGYSCKVQEDYEIDGIRGQKTCVELHTDYFASDTDFYDSMGQPFGADETEQDRLNELYLYNVLHVAKHYFAGGCGIRRVLDMYFIERNYGKRICREYVDGVLGRRGVLTFARELVLLAEEWFGDNGREGCTGTMDRYILEAGLHGNRENFINSRMRKIRDSRKISAGTKLKYLVSRLFPGDRVMLKHYPVLKKWRILYPYFWIHRIVRMLLGKNRSTSVLDLQLVLRADRDDR